MGSCGRLTAAFVGCIIAATWPSNVQAQRSESNPELADVVSQFANLTLRGEWLGWRRHSPPIAPMTSTTPTPGSSSAQHYQGIARSPRIDTAPVLYVTRSGDVNDASNLGSLLVIRMGSRNRVGERLRSNRLGPEETKDTVPPADDVVIANIPFTDYQHPGGIQMVGDILAVPLEGPVDASLPDGRVIFFDCSNPENPVQLAYHLDFDHSVGVLGITKLPASDGKFLLVTSFGDGTSLTFHRSNEPSFDAPNFGFDLHGTVYASNVQGVFRTGKTTPQTLNLINQADGRVFIVGSSNSKASAPFLNGDDDMFLYEVTGFEDGGIPEMVQQDVKRHKSLRSKGNKVFSWGPLGDEFALLTAICAAGSPTPELCLIAVVDAVIELNDNFSKQEANFNAAGGAYISPTGELLYYSTAYYNLGVDNIGRMAELRHKYVSRNAVCGPQFRPNHLGGPYTVPENGMVEINGEVYVIQPWVDMFEHDNFNCNSPTDCDPNAHSVMMDFPDQGADRYDDFKKLDGAGLLGDNGFNDRLTSFRFCGAPGSVLTIYDDDSFSSGGNAPDFVVAGSGAIVEVPNVGSAFNDEATSAQIVNNAPAPGYFWDANGDGDFECTPTDYSQCNVLGGGKRLVFMAGCGSSTNLVQMKLDGNVVGATVNVENVPPTIDSMQLSPSLTAEADTVTLSATWSDVCANFHAAQIKWGDGVKTDLDLGVAAAGSFTASHVYGDNGVYNVTLSLSDEDDTAASSLGHAVSNVSPVVGLDTADAVVLPGGTAFLGRLGHSQDHAASGNDVGSDDLRFRWTADDQVFPATDVFADTTYFNDGIGPDPFPSSQGVFPFHADDLASVLFDDPGVYVVTADLYDDDGGSDSEAAFKLVSGDDSCTRNVGLWRQQFSDTGAQQADDETLIRYLHYVAFASTYFEEMTSLATIADASSLLRPGGAEVGEVHPSNQRGKAVSALLAAWLNVASGSVSMLGPADEREATGPSVLTILHQLEQVLADPTSGVVAHREANRALDRISNRGCTTSTN